MTHILQMILYITGVVFVSFSAIAVMSLIAAGVIAVYKNLWNFLKHN